MLNFARNVFDRVVRMIMRATSGMHRDPAINSSWLLPAAARTRISKVQAHFACDRNERTDPAFPTAIYVRVCCNTSYIHRRASTSTSPGHKVRLGEFLFLWPRRVCWVDGRRWQNNQEYNRLLTTQSVVLFIYFFFIIIKPIQFAFFF